MAIKRKQQELKKKGTKQTMKVSQQTGLFYDLFFSSIEYLSALSKAFKCLI